MHHSSLLSPSPFLSDQINVATRSAHTHINRLIIERLPLLLPPHTIDPSVYVSGLLRIAPIYSTFEESWKQILKNSCRLTEENHNLTSDFQGLENINSHMNSISTLQNSKFVSSNQSTESCSRIEYILNSLLLPDLLRAQILRDDIGKLTSTPENEVKIRIESVSSAGSLSRFLEHMRKNIKKNPHVLLAYAWVLYMALFSGGRYIRSTLKLAGGQGAEFWSKIPSTVPLDQEKRLARCESNFIDSGTNPSPNIPITSVNTFKSKVIPGLGLFYFAGDADGEDIKIEFKRRMRDAENHLTTKEREDIVLEAQYIFEFMIDMIKDMDLFLGTTKNDKDTLLIMKEYRFLTRIRDCLSIKFY